ncbi:hypothetical protein MEBOL_003471 [Melittangium boletus DSM 14713]|uniref:1-phosphatidylinositol phosphodiesterase n=2 Tax=Melittangium boletus TaxID=83453 RepID=A0A250IGE8_9BACT|nr:hypothetical protein MEBOL_003471 [Melittangium boletus DSM 14713]
MSTSTLLGLLLTNVCFAQTPEQEKAAATPSSAQPGYIADKNKPFNQYTWLTAHNAFSYGNYGGVNSSQSMNLSEQLEKGVRGMMLDLHVKDGDIYLCHGTCLPGSLKFETALKNSILPFLRNNRNEVVTLFFEDYSSKEDLQKVFSNTPEVATYIFKPEGWPSGTWPTLAAMINKNERLLILSSKSGNSGSYNGGAYVINERALTVENTYNLGNALLPDDGVHDYDCEKRGESAELNTAASSTYKNWPRPFVMNHFHQYTVLGAHSDFDNRFDKILKRDKDHCRSKANRPPSYIALDYVDKGDAMEYVEWRNNGGVIFYEGDNATQDIVCGIGTQIKRTLNLQSSDEARMGCENDEMRSAVLSGIRKGTRIKLYDSPSGDRQDDYAIIDAKRDIGIDERVVISSLETNSDNADYTIRFLRNNGLNGKVSRIEVDPQPTDFPDSAIVLYEGGSASQNIVCTLPLTSSTFVNFKNDGYGCDNDEARSAKILEAKAGTTITVYDDPNGGTGDDYTSIRVKKNIQSPRVVGSFESSFSDEYLEVTFKRKNGLNGKVSSARISAATRAGEASSEAAPPPPEGAKQ